eukprot:scaffold43190_cov59-Phaeocystis_antarctica.AAC.2
MGVWKLSRLRVTSPGRASCTSARSSASAFAFAASAAAEAEVEVHFTIGFSPKEAAGRSAVEDTSCTPKLGQPSSRSSASSLKLTIWKSLMRWKVITGRWGEKMSPRISMGHSASMASRLAPPRTGSWTSESGLSLETAHRTSRRQLGDLK